MPEDISPAKQKFDHDSERVFCEYLEKHQIVYKREYHVGPGNVDFLVERNGSCALCDVKAVVQPPKMAGRVEAQLQIRGDLKKLRQKFKERPTDPCVLVSLNYSPQIFTGLSVRTAMLGDVGVAFEVGQDQASVSEPFHLEKGNAFLRKDVNTGISGILVLDPAFGEHCFFANPYAANPLVEGFFPSVREFAIQKTDEGGDLIGDSDVMFYPHDMRTK
jgi:hypothetical protein